MKTLGIEASKENPIQLPLAFLLHLGTALRLLLWERQGYVFHREAGLPSARQAIHDASQSLLKPNLVVVNRLNLEVLKIAMKRLAWSGPRELGAEVAILQEELEDQFLEDLADFLWNQHVRSRAER